MKRAHAFDLVDDGYDRLAALLQHARHFPVVGGETCGQIGHKDDHVRHLDRQFRLAAHIAEDRIVRFGLVRLFF